MIMSLKMKSLFNPQSSSHGIMDKQLENESDNSSNNSSNTSGDEDQEVNSSDSSSPTSNSPLQDMSSSLKPLPFKRGLSKHYNGKAKSFTCLSDVKSLKDLPKAENPYNKRLKTLQKKKNDSEIIARNSSSNISNNCSLLVDGSRRDISGFLGNERPPIPAPHRSASTSCFINQNPLFA